MWPATGEGGEGERGREGRGGAGVLPIYVTAV